MTDISSLNERLSEMEKGIPPALLLAGKMCASMDKIDDCLESAFRDIKNLRRMLIIVSVALLLTNISIYIH